MQVKIENNCFQHQSNYDDLDVLLSLFQSEQHIWIDIDLEHLQSTEWYAELGKRDKKDIDRWFVRSTRKSNKKKTVSVSNNPNNNFNIRAGILFLKQPLVILIENKEYDSPFFEAIFQHFDKINGELNDSHINKFWKYEHFAGSSVDQVVNGEINNEFKNEVFKEPKKRYLRYFVILDSDLLYPSNINNTLESKKQFLIEKEVSFHVLQKREKENYMPESILKTLNKPYFNTVIKVFKNEINRKRDFFDFEKGFNNKNKTDKDWKDKRKDEFNFFEIDCINDEDYKILKSGVEDKQEFKRSFSQYFLKVSKSDFLAVIKHQPLIKSKHDGVERNEFEHIIHEIKYLL